MEITGQHLKKPTFILAILVMICGALFAYFWIQHRTSTSFDLDKAILDSFEQEQIAAMRQEIGIAAKIGQPADTLFYQIDQVRSALLQVITKGRVSHLPSDSLLSKELQTFANIPVRLEVWLISFISNATADSADGKPGSVALLALLLTSPNLFVKGNGSDSPQTLNMETNEGNVHGELSLTPKIVGSDLTVDAKLTVRALVNGVPYEESSEGVLKISLCPDVQGRVPFELFFKINVSAGGTVGAQRQWSAKSEAQVDDDGNLSSYDLDIQASAAAQSDSGGNQYFEYRQHFAFHGKMNDLKNSSFQLNNPVLIRTSSKIDSKFMYSISSKLSAAIVTMTHFSLMQAEEKWQHGYCVKVAIPEFGNATIKTVKVHSKTSFTAYVRHQFESGDLPLPIIGTLIRGEISIDPSGRRTPAPVHFVYKAPDKRGETAMVQFETRSRRGIDHLDMSFKCSAGWKIDETISNERVGSMHYTGISCESEKGPWKIVFDGSGYGVNTKGELSGIFDDSGQAQMNGEYQISIPAGGYTVTGHSDDRGTLINEGDSYLMKLTGGSYTQDHQFAGGSGRVVGRVGGMATGDFVYQGLRAHAESSVQ